MKVFSKAKRQAEADRVIHAAGYNKPSRLTLQGMRKLCKDLLQSGADVKILSVMPDHYSVGFTLGAHAHASASMRQQAGGIRSVWVKPNTQQEPPGKA